MSDPLLIPSGNAEHWLNELRPYQISTIRQYLKTTGFEGAAEKWLSTTGTADIIPFGGGRGSRMFWDRFKAEFRQFLCDESAYSTVKELLKKEAPITRASFIAVVGSALASTLGLTAVLVTPALVLMMAAVAEMGRQAFCQNDARNVDTTSDE